MRVQGSALTFRLVTVTSRVVTAVDATAAALGLQPGMKLAQAQALVPGLTVHDADLPGDAALLRRLAEWCLRYAPLAAARSAGRTLDRRHRQHTSAWRGNAAAARSGQSAEFAKVWPRAPPLPTPRLSRMRWPGLALAAWCPRASDVMAAFPIEALRLPADMLADLRLMGFERVGPLAAAAASAFGAAVRGWLAKRLDQAAGRVVRADRAGCPAQRRSRPGWASSNRC